MAPSGMGGNESPMIMHLSQFARTMIGMAGLMCASLAPAHAAPVRDGHVVAELVARESAFVPGQPVTVGVHLTMDPTWHTYWRNSGDSGLTTTIKWTLPKGFEAGPIDWPTPTRLPLSTIMNYGYEGDVLLTSPIRTAALNGARAQIKARVDWLVCSAEECIPGGADLVLSLPVGASALPDPAHAALFEKARAQLPQPAPKWEFATQRLGDGSYRLTARPLSGQPLPGGAYFFADDAGVTQSGAPQNPTLDNGVLSVTLKPSQYAQGTPTALNGVWVAQGWGDGVTAARVTARIGAGGGAVHDPLVPAPASGADLATLGGMLLTAFIGGMILNLMPCVFPVLSLKIMGFVQSAGDDRRKIALHGWIYVLGVLVSFWVLAGTLMGLRAAGAQLAWGFQLQSPIIVVMLCLLLLTLAFSLLGIFEMGAGLVGAAGRVRTKGGISGSFMSGVLATVLATPCTAPFMGTALAFALTQSTFIGFVVFTALALGMASPYLVLSLRPQWLAFLPKPGAWMDTLKQAMAFPLLGTIIWLLWVFGQQTGMNGLLQAMVAMLLLSIGLWAWGRWGTMFQEAPVRRFALGLLTLCGGAALWFAYAGSLLLPPAAASDASGEWQAFTPEKLAQMRSEGKPVFVDFSAAWCATCIVNKQMVLSRPDVSRSFRNHGVVLMEADWTRRDATITKILAANGRSGVPLHILYAPGAGEPLLVRDLVTTDEILKALDGLPTASPQA